MRLPTNDDNQHEPSDDGRHGESMALAGSAIPRRLGLRAGNWIVVRSKDEILATLDASGCHAEVAGRKGCSAELMLVFVAESEFAPDQRDEVLESLLAGQRSAIGEEPR